MEKKETGLGLMSEAERETRRKQVIQRLFELSKVFEDDNLSNEINFKEAQALEKELLEVSPISTNPGTQKEIQERRSHSEQRATMERFLEYVRSLNK